MLVNGAWYNNIPTTLANRRGFSQTDSVEITSNQNVIHLAKREVPADENELHLPIAKLIGAVSVSR